MKRKMAPSILAADFKRLGEEIRICAENGAEYLHFDVMDGNFVPNISFGIPVLQSIRDAADIVLDVHLMIEEPIRYVNAFCEAGADILTVHYEACKDLAATLQAIHAAGKKAGITIKPDTPVDVLVPFLDQAELFLIMSVEPGAGGQDFMPESLDKIHALRTMLDDAGLDADIEVDGGIRYSNVEQVLDAGANVIVTGTAVFKGDIAGNMKKFMEILERDE
jgi:ribulose-phosphate 3-epimerase